DLLFQHLNRRRHLSAPPELFFIILLSPLRRKCCRASVPRPGHKLLPPKGIPRANGESHRERRTIMRDTTPLVAAAVMGLAAAPATPASVPTAASPATGELRQAEIHVGIDDGDLRGSDQRA